MRRVANPRSVTVLLDPIGIDPVDRDHGKATVACGVFDEVRAVCGADDSAGPDEGFNALAIGACGRRLWRLRGTFEGFGFALADDGIDFTPLMVQAE